MDCIEIHARQSARRNNRAASHNHLAEVAAGTARKHEVERVADAIEIVSVESTITSGAARDDQSRRGTWIRPNALD